MDWYKKNIEESLSELKANLQGLSETEALERSQKFGLNEFRKEKTHKFLKILFAQCINPLVIILFAAAMLKLFINSFLEGIVIIITVLLIIIIGFIQESKAEKAMEALKKLTPPYSRVKRNNIIQSIESSALVPGDILVLEPGDKVSADARVVEIHDLEVNESFLTGESKPIKKQVKTIFEETPITGRNNMLFSGSFITKGKGLALVTSIGAQTELGRIALKMQEIKKDPSPLQKNISRLSNWILSIISLLVLIFVIIGYMSGMPWLDIILLAIAIAVAAIPEGLPVSVTVVLSTGAYLLAKKKGIIRKLLAVETLGSANVICSDKTGTLTKNEMELTLLGTVKNIVDFSKLNKEKIDNNFVYKNLFRIGFLCNDAQLNVDEKDEKKYLGDPTEIAILRGFYKIFADEMQTKTEFPRVFEIPFSSEIQYMATVNIVEGKKYIFTKGSSEKIISLCSSYLEEDKIKTLDKTVIFTINEINKQLASKGMRVLAGAYKPLENASNMNESIVKDLIFVGFFAINDPPRKEVKEAIIKCFKAGIKITMITGDSRETALAIANDLNIPSDIAFTGDDINKATDQQLAAMLEKNPVLARIEPLQKLKIVCAYQSKGLVVAMTGDGVNDAPALEKADIGIAMGKNGTDVAKEASDIILVDDNFSTIVDCVEEGRTIFARLRNVAAFLLTTCFGEVSVIFLAFLFVGKTPLQPLQILWINLITGSLIAIPLGIEEKTGDELMHPPRDPRVGLLFPGMIFRITFLAITLSFGCFFIFYYFHEHIAYARTMTFISVILFEWLLAFQMRSDEKGPIELGLLKNNIFIIGGLLAILFIFLIVYVPVLKSIFHTSSLSFLDWCICLIPGIFVLIFESIRKKFFPKLFSYGKWKPKS